MTAIEQAELDNKTQIQVIRMMLDEISNRMEREYGMKAHEAQEQLWRVRDSLMLLERRMNAVV